MTGFKRGSGYKYHFVVDGVHIQRSTRQGNLRVAIEMEAAHRTRLAKDEGSIKCSGHNICTEMRKPTPNSSPIGWAQCR
jgi:hypothetical protein